MKIRAVKLVLTLGDGKFSNGENQKTIYSVSLAGYLHTQINLERNMGINGNNATINIFGMTIDDCNSLTILNPDSLSVSNLSNQVEIYAGYLNTESYPITNPDGTYNQANIITLCDILPEVFLGKVISANPNYNDPNRPFIIQAMISGASSYKILEPLSISTPQSLTTVLTTMIASVNKVDKNRQYVLGSIVPETIIQSGVYNADFNTILYAICQDYGYQEHRKFEGKKVIISLSQLGVGLDSTTSILKADDGSCTGMIGYPMSAPFGIIVQTYYNPDRNVGEVVTLESWAKIYNANWRIWSISSVLCTQDEQWQSVLVLYQG
jgi:hypothetical protein